jgi:hypothetical protein
MQAVVPWKRQQLQSLMADDRFPDGLTYLVFLSIHITLSLAAQ